MNLLRPRFLSSCILGVLTLWPAFAATAQVAVTRPAGGQAQNPPEDTVSLNPFVVNAEKDVGYIASETLAGSRFGTKLADTPATLSVLTSEFLADTGAFDLTAALEYANNVELELDDDRPVANGQATIGSYQGYRVRGLKTTQARNYFSWDVPANTYNVDRVEDSRGPNSVLFGIALPGGLLNVMTKRAQTQRSFRKVTLTAGSYDSYRAALDVNQVLLPDKLALRFNTVKDRANGFRHWSFKDSQLADLAVTYNVSRRMQVRAEVEFGQVDSNVPRTYGLMDSVELWSRSGRPTYATQVTNADQGIARQSTAATAPRVTLLGNENLVIAMRGTMRTTGNDELIITDSTVADDSVNPVGPGRNRTSRYNNVSAFLDYELAAKTFIGFAYNHQDHTFDRFDPAQAANVLKGNPGQLRANNTPDPHAGQLYLEIDNGFRNVSETLSDAGRAMLSSELEAGQWGHYRLGAYFDYLRAFNSGHRYSEIWVDANTGRAAFNATPENSQNRVYRRRYVTEHDWATYYVDTPFRTGLIKPVTDPITGRTLASAWVGGSTGGVFESYDTQKTYLLAGQARYFDRRLVAAVGIRRDQLTTHRLGAMRDPVTRELIQAHRETDATEGSTFTRTTTGNTKTVGLVYHLTPWLSASANFADNVQPSSGTLILRSSGEPGQLRPAPLPTGVGRDFGLNLALLDGRLNVRGLFFTTKSEDNSTTFSGAVRDANARILDALRERNAITQAEYDVRGEVGTNNLYDYQSDGYEFEATANLTKNLRFRANYSITSAVQNKISLEWKAWAQLNGQWLSRLNTAGIVTSSGRTVAQEVALYEETLAQTTATDGVSNLGARRHKLNFFGRYNLPFERLKGTYVGGGYLHQSKMFVGVDSAGKHIFGNSYWRADAMAGYGFAMKQGRTLNFQLNIKNVLDQRAPLVSRYTAAGLITRWILQSPMTWQFTSTLEF